jgi:hypothetical protein
MKGEAEKICCTNRERAEQGKNLLLAMSLRLLARLRQSLQSVSFVPNIEACRMDMRRSARAKRMVFSNRLELDCSSRYGVYAISRANLCDRGQQVEPAKQGRAVVDVVRSDDSTGK